MQVHSSKMIRGLKHKIQDKTDEPVEEQIPGYGGSSCKQFKPDILNAQLRKFKLSLGHIRAH